MGGNFPRLILVIVGVAIVFFAIVFGLAFAFG